MILTELKIKGLRSFCEEETIKIEPDVTVLTGANDVGKTAVLHLVRMMCRTEIAGEGDINFEARRRSTESLEESQEFVICGTFIPGEVDAYLKPKNVNYTKLQMAHYASQGRHRLLSVFDRRDHDIKLVHDISLHELPTVIDLTLEDAIRPRIVLNEINPNEDHLLAQAFGPRYKEQLLEYSEEEFHSQRRGGVENLNRRLRKVMPDSLRLGFAIEVDRNETLSFVVGVVDELTGDTPVRLRGAGAQRLLRLLTSLLDVDAPTEHIIILVDEPENSLHADAQHALRYVLETLANEPLIQVIYATHSSCMINTTRPRSLRLLTREFSESGNPTTRVNNEPYKGGRYQLVRSSLGVTPADSLLYAAITVIAEGDTEALVLGEILEFFMQESSNVQSELESILGQIHVMGAGGYSEVYKWAKMAQSQGSQPIVLVDGDVDTSFRNQARRELPEVPIVYFDDRKEIEDIVPRSSYFAALAKLIEPNDMVTEDRFNHWCFDHMIPEDMMFSKRVQKWVRCEFEYGINKPQTMRKAIQLTDYADLDLAAIRELVEEIRKIANRL